MRKLQKRRKRFIILTVSILAALAFSVASFTVFFDQAVLVRKGTIFRVGCRDKIVAFTFDDGPSPVWTPQILDELKIAGIKATFFMTGEHVANYPAIARRVAEELHEIGNHSYAHHVLLYYKMDELRKDIKDTEKIIHSATGQTTKYFRPPKAWLTSREKKEIQAMGYKIVLWSLNSKDWVTFNDKYIIKYLMRHIRPGDIILFHDSGGLFNIEGGNRAETVKTIHRLTEKLKERGYRFVTITELLNAKCNE
jgi:peptidoglycan/xylan/chitin deacetylase (PgdA/CDA1 family)